MQSLPEMIAGLQRDFSVVEAGQNFHRIGGDLATRTVWSEARSMAILWLDRVKAEASRIDPSAIQPVLIFGEALIAIANGGGQRQDENLIGAINRAKLEFKASAPIIALAIIEATGLLGFSETKMSGWRDTVISDVRSEVASTEAECSASVDEAIVKIRDSAEQAVKDFDSAKARASKISIDSAQIQFKEAAHGFKRKGFFWAGLTALLFAGLVAILWWLLKNPPSLVREIAEATRPGSHSLMLSVPIPLLVVTGAYFTGIRLAIIGVLGIGLAFSLRMTRAYIHMLEHNQHKLRVTNSIEAFVAAVRTNEQKDLVLSKLVESVTEFGDSGILGKQGEASGLPSVIFEAMTKNVSKVD